MSSIRRLAPAAVLALAVVACDGDSQSDFPLATLAAEARAAGRTELSVTGSAQFETRLPIGLVSFRTSGNAQRRGDGRMRGELETVGTLPYPGPDGQPIGQFSVGGSVVCAAAARRADGLHVLVLHRVEREQPRGLFTGLGASYGYLYVVEGADGTQRGWAGPAAPPLLPGVLGPCEVPAERPADATPLVPLGGRYTLRVAR